MSYEGDVEFLCAHRTVLSRRQELHQDSRHGSGPFIPTHPSEVIKYAKMVSI